MSLMAGGEGSLEPGTSASAGPQSQLKMYPTKRNAKKEAAATGPHCSANGCSTKRKAASRDPASGRTSRPRATESATGSKSTKAEAPAGEQKKRLSKGDIKWILNQKPLVPRPTSPL